MKKGWLIALIVVGVLGIFGAGCIGTVLGFRSDCIQAEAGLEAQYKANQSTYDSMWKTFKEMTQVSDIYANRVRDLFKDAISGRYGAEGSKQVFLALKEDNPHLDPTLYTKIETAVEAGRTRFNQDQKELLDRKSQYEVILNSNAGAIVNVLFHFPHKDISKFDIVTSDVTERAFTSKKADEIKLQ